MFIPDPTLEKFVTPEMKRNIMTRPVPIPTSRELSTTQMGGQGLLGKIERGASKIGSFLGIEKLGRRAGYELAKLDPEYRRNLQALSEAEKKGYLA